MNIFLPSFVTNGFTLKPLSRLMSSSLSNPTKVFSQKEPTLLEFPIEKVSTFRFLTWSSIFKTNEFRHTPFRFLIEARITILRKT